MSLCLAERAPKHPENLNLTSYGLEVTRCDFFKYILIIDLSKTRVKTLSGNVHSSVFPL